MIRPSVLVLALLSTFTNGFPLNKRIAQSISASTTKWEAACRAAGGDGQCNDIAVAAFSNLLAAPGPCEQQKSADKMIELAKELGNDPDMIKFAQIFVQQPRNTPNSVSVPYCQEAPRYSQLNGLFQCQFQGADPTTFVGNLKVGAPGTVPLGQNKPLDPPGSCPANPNGPIPDGAQLVDITQDPGVENLGEGSPDANSTTEATSASPTDTSAASPTDTSAASSTDTSAATPTDASTETPTDTPTECPAETATEEPAETPTETTTETPAETATETASTQYAGADSVVTVTVTTTLGSKASPTAPPEASSTAPPEASSTALPEASPTALPEVSPAADPASSPEATSSSAPPAASSDAASPTGGPPVAPAACAAKQKRNFSPRMSIAKRIAQNDLVAVAQSWQDLCLASGGDTVTDDPCVKLAGLDGLNALLAGTDACAQQRNADAMIDFANSPGVKNRDALIANAVAYRKHARNALDIGGGLIPSTPYCTEPPRNEELVGLVNAQLDGVNPGLFGGPKTPVVAFGAPGTCPFGQRPDVATCTCKF